MDLDDGITLRAADDPTIKNELRRAYGRGPGMRLFVPAAPHGVRRRPHLAVGF